MKLSAEQIASNWGKLIKVIEEFSGDRRDKLLQFYKKYEDRLIMMPASHKKEYHGAFPGGYVAHVLNVIKNSNLLYDVWKTAGADLSTFTKEELIFSALNHDLGKMGDSEFEAYIPQTDSWRKEKLGEDYMFNKNLPFASVPDRGLFLLQSHGIPYSFNEMIAIQTHDGLYDEANKKYLQVFMPEQKPRTNIVYILHQADLMSARIEFEQEWMGEFSKNNLEKKEGNGKLKQTQKKTDKALGSIQSKNLTDFLSNITE